MEISNLLNFVIDFESAVRQAEIFVFILLSVDYGVLVTQPQYVFNTEI